MGTYPHQSYGNHYYIVEKTMVRAVNERGSNKGAIVLEEPWSIYPDTQSCNEQLIERGQFFINSLYTWPFVAPNTTQHSRR